MKNVTSREVLQNKIMETLKSGKIGQKEISDQITIVSEKTVRVCLAELALAGKILKSTDEKKKVFWEIIEEKKEEKIDQIPLKERLIEATKRSKVKAEKITKEKKPREKSKLKLRLKELFLQGEFTGKDIIELMKKEFPEIKEVTVRTLITDSKNKKYNPFKDVGIVVKLKNGKLKFK